MPPKTKYTLNDVLDAAINIVRREGLEKLTARAIAEELHSSTMPIYSCGKTMTEIEEEVIRKSWEILAEYQLKPMTPDPYINMGLGYVLFATHEKNLFGCIHSLKHMELNKELGESNLIRNLVGLSGYPPLSGIPDDLKMKIMIQGWIFSHGLADLISKNFGETINGLHSDEDLTAFFYEANRINFVGVQKIVEESMKNRIS